MMFLDLDLDLLRRLPVVASQTRFWISNSMASVVLCKWCSLSATFFIHPRGLSWTMLALFVLLVGKAFWCWGRVLA